jgi:hypothetical protein
MNSLGVMKRFRKFEREAPPYWGHGFFLGWADGKASLAAC